MKITEKELLSLINNNAGYCDKITVDEGIEPDASYYECDECGEREVMGIDLALICGNFQIEDVD